MKGLENTVLGLFNFQPLKDVKKKKGLPEQTAHQDKMIAHFLGNDTFKTAIMSMSCKD